MLLPTPAEIRHWDRVLAKDGLPSDAALRHYTFPGGLDEMDGRNRHGAHVTLWDRGIQTRAKYGVRSRISIENIAEDPRFQFWSVAAQRASKLPRNYRGRRVILAIAQTGNIRGSALRNGLSWWSGRSLWRRFVRACGLPDTQAGSLGRLHRSQRPDRLPRHAAQNPPPARTLTKREIARLHLEPPRAIR